MIRTSARPSILFQFLYGQAVVFFRQLQSEGTNNFNGTLGRFIFRGMEKQKSAPLFCKRQILINLGHFLAELYWIRRMLLALLKFRSHFMITIVCDILFAESVIEQ